MKYNETYEKIEAYLRGKLSEEDRILFQQKIQEDNELAEQVHLQESDHLVMEVLVENDLRKRLKQWQGEKEAKKKRERDEWKPPFWRNWGGALLGLLVLGGVCYSIYTGWSRSNILPSKEQLTQKEKPAATPSDMDNEPPTSTTEEAAIQEEEKKDLKAVNPSGDDPKKVPESSIEPKTNPPKKSTAKATKVPPTRMEEIASFKNLGNTFYNKGEYEQAIVYYEKALKIQLEILGEKHPDIAKSYEKLGDVYQKKGDARKANEYHLKFLEMQPDAVTPPESTPTNSITTIIDDHDDLSRYDELWESRSTEELLNALDSALLDLKNKSYDLAVQKLAPNYAQNSDDAGAAYYLGMAYYEQRSLGEAIPLLQKVAANKFYGSKRQAEWILALAYLRNGQLEDGKVLLEEIKKDEWGDYAGVADQLLEALKRRD